MRRTGQPSAQVAATFRSPWRCGAAPRRAWGELRSPWRPEGRRYVKSWRCGAAPKRAWGELRSPWRPKVAATVCRAYGLHRVQRVFLKFRECATDVRRALAENLRGTAVAARGWANDLSSHSHCLERSPRPLPRRRRCMAHRPGMQLLADDCLRGGMRRADRRHGVSGMSRALWQGRSVERRTVMPEKETLEAAEEDRREGKSPSTQAGEFDREEMHHIREGKHGARSTKQAIAIGLSKARRAGVHLPPPEKGQATERTRQSAKRAVAAGRRRKKAVSQTRSRATRGALKREGRRAASK